MLKFKSVILWYEETMGEYDNSVRTIMGINVDGKSKV